MSSRTDLPHLVRLVMGLIGTVLVAGTVIVVISYGQGYYDDGYRVHAVFPSSSQGLFTDGGTDVKLRGTNVGTVDGIELLDDGRARITLFIDHGIRVPDTATATIEPLSVFGPKFVRLDPGDHEATGPFLRDGDEIARGMVGVELTRILDQATDLLAAIDPNDLLAITEAVSEGVVGMGDELGRTIDSAAVLSGIADRHTEELKTFLGDLAVLSGTAADHRDDMVAIVDHLGEILPALNEHADELDEVLDVTTAISTRFSTLLDANRTEFSTTVRAVSRFIHGIYQESEDLPDVLDLVGTFFGRLSDVLRFDAPSQKLLGGLRGFLSLDLCLLFQVCPGEIAS